MLFSRQEERLQLLLRGSNISSLGNTWLLSGQDNLLLHDSNISSLRNTWLLFGQDERLQLVLLRYCFEQSL